MAFHVNVNATSLGTLKVNLTLLLSFDSLSAPYAVLFISRTVFLYILLLLLLLLLLFQAVKGFFLPVAVALQRDSTQIHISHKNNTTQKQKTNHTKLHKQRKDILQPMNVICVPITVVVIMMSLYSVDPGFQTQPKN
jgi:hypothetical protein